MNAAEDQTAPLDFDAFDLEDLFSGDFVLTSADGLVDFMVVDGVFFVRNNEVGEWLFFDHTYSDFEPDEYVDFAHEAEVIGQATGNFWTDLLSAGYNAVAEGLKQIPDANFQKGFGAVDKALRPKHYQRLEEERKKKAKEDKRKKAKARKARKEREAQSKRRKERKKRRERLRREREKKHGSASFRERHRKWRNPGRGRHRKSLVLRLPGMPPIRYSVETTYLGFLSTRYATVSSGKKTVVIRIAGEDCEFKV